MRGERWDVTHAPKGPALQAGAEDRSAATLPSPIICQTKGEPERPHETPGPPQPKRTTQTQKHQAQPNHPQTKCQQHLEPQAVPEGAETLPPKGQRPPQEGRELDTKTRGGGWQAGTRSTKPMRANRTKEPMGERESAREQMCERAGACARPGIRKMKQKRLEKKTKARHLVQERLAEYESITSTHSQATGHQNVKTDLVEKGR